MYCRSCGFKLDDDAVFCMNCGVKVANDTSSKYCAHCGNELEADAVFCMSCGNKIHDDSKEPEKATNTESEIIKEKTVESTEQNEVPVSDTVPKDIVIENETVTTPTNDEVAKETSFYEQRVDGDEKQDKTLETTTTDFPLLSTREYRCLSTEEKDSYKLKLDSLLVNEKIDAETKRNICKTLVQYGYVYYCYSKYMPENKSAQKTDSLDEKSESIEEYKDISVNGRHFLYLDDSKKVFCPKCKKRVDSASTVCSWCNTSFMTDMNEKSNNNSSISQPIVSEYYEEKRTDSVADSTESPAKSKTGLLVAAIFIALAICWGISISKNFSTPVQNSSSSFTSSDTFNFDVLKPYTFNYSDEWDSYEFDCYKLYKKSLEDLWNNLPRYVIYNGKKRELNIKYIDYFDVVENSDEFGDAETILKKYNVIIVWDNYDGSYYHFGGLQIRKGRKGMYLYPKSN